MRAALPWLVGILLVASTAVAAADARCKPSARVSGESLLVAAIEPLLRARGIEVLAAAPDDSAFVGQDCGHVTADVASGGERIMVWLTDAEGRRTQRLTEDPEAAATMIESWARGDLVDPLLAARGAIDIGAGFGGSSSVAARVPEPAPRPRYMVTGGGDLGVSGDGALWAGGRVQGCGLIGAFCVGGVIRYAIDLEAGGDTKELGTSRTAFGLAVIGELPLRPARFLFSPGVGLGMTSVTATNQPEGELEQASAFHGRAAIAGAYEFARAWSLRVDVAADFAPFARTRLGEADGMDIQLAASPNVQTWFGISIAYGGP